MSDQNKDEISIILTNPAGTAAESIVVSSTATTLEELATLSVALGVASDGSGGDSITLAVDGKVVYDGSDGTRTLGEAGVKGGDMVLVGSGRAAPAPAPSAPAPAPAAAGGGGLDFSALLASAGASASASTAAPAPAAASGGGGLTFNIAGLEMAASASLRTVEWPNMSLDDAMERNPNPAYFVPLLLR